MVGRTIAGKYQIASVLGSGAMGTIFKAEQTALGKTVVIKVLHRHLLGDPELIQRFHREARAASRLNHPNCVQIMDFGTLDDGALYIAMEFIQGIDLATLLERSHPIDFRRLIHIAKQVCQALDEAHANGVLHRDLKPENIMIEDRRNVRDHVKVVDFGIAKLEENNPNSRRQFQTRTGIVCGTPEYMSPEQARGQKLDARSDLYAVGVMLYHLTTDQLPFDAPSPIEVVTKHISEPPIPPRMYRSDLPEALEQLILTLLEKDREKRPASALDVQAELERIDRELAAARREKVETKTNDDATMVDMRPISVLVAAIDVAKGSIVVAPDTQDDTTDQVLREALMKAGNAGTATDLNLTDTIPESGSPHLKARLAEAQAQSAQASSAATLRETVRQKKPAGPSPAAGIVPGAPKTPTQTPVKTPARNSGLTQAPPKPSSIEVKAKSVGPSSAELGVDVKRASDAQAKGRGAEKLPDTSLVREGITIDASAAPNTARPHRKSRLWLWIVLGAIALGGGGTAVFFLTR